MHGKVESAAPAELRYLNCSASLSNGLLTLEDGTRLELADLVDFVNGVALKVIPSSNDAEHDLLVEVIGEAGSVLNRSGLRRIRKVEDSHGNDMNSSVDTRTSLKNQRDLLAEVLGKCVIASGIVHSSIDGLSGPQLLMFGADLADMLAAQRQQHYADDAPGQGT